MKHFLLKAYKKYFERDDTNNKITEKEKIDYYTVTVDDNAVYNSNNFMIALQCQFYTFSDNCPFQEGENIYSNPSLKSMGFTVCIPTSMKCNNSGDFFTITVEALGIFDTKEEIELVKNL